LIGGKSLSCLTFNILLEKFDDLKFGKVLSKLYTKLFSLEQQKSEAPKFSHSLKDLAKFLGVFEMSEELVGSQVDEESKLA